MNTSSIAQHSLYNSSDLRNWNVLALQEPNFTKTGTTPCPRSFYCVYPSIRPTAENTRCRAVTLVSRQLDTNSWRSLPFPSKDVVVVQFLLGQRRCTLFNIYNEIKNDDTLQVLSHYLTSQAQVIRPHPDDHIIILGDFNRHHPLWEDERNAHLLTTQYINKSRNLLSIITDHALLMTLPKGLPTLHSTSSKNWTRVDNVFCTDHTAELFDSCTTYPEHQGPATDHVPILSVVDLTLPTQRDEPTRNFRDVDWKVFNEKLSAELPPVPNSPISTDEEFQREARILMSSLLNTIEHCVPTTKPTPWSKRWWTKELTTMRSNLSKLGREAHRLKHNMGHPIHDEYRRMRNKYADNIKTTKKQHWVDWLEDITGNEIWIANKYITTLAGEGTHTRIPSLRTPNSDPASIPQATTNEEKSRLLATTFFPPPPAHSSVPTDPSYPEPIPLPTVVTEASLLKAIQRLSPYKAPGPDGICNVVFQKCSDTLTPHLLRLFTATLSSEYFYDPWKDFITVVLRKPGRPDYTVPKAYRPIALLNTTYKLLSSIVAEQLTHILESNNLLPATHFGGRPGKSTTDSLHLLEATVKHAWRNHKVASVLFLDIEGAFPNAVTDRLLHNMQNRRIPEVIISFTKRALTNRRTKLRFDGYLSDWRPINNGIGQGDPLSMVLYIIYNADLLEIASPRNGETAQAFVDDTMLMATGKTFAETHAKLKNMMEREGGGYDWAKAHNSRFETSKFALIDFSSQASKDRPNLTLRETTIKPSQQHKFLGVIVDQSLKWTAQVSNAIAKGTAYVLQLKRLSSYSFGMPMSLMKQLYLAVAVPKMLYAIDVWFRPFYSTTDDKKMPGSINVSRKLASVQRTAILSITGAFRSSPTDYLEILSNVWPIHHRIHNLCHQAAVRIASLPPSHPLTYFYSRAAKHFVKSHRSSLHYLTHLFDVKPGSVEKIPPFPFSPTTPALFTTSIPASKEEAIRNHDDIITRRGTFLYSDGSAINNSVGAAAILWKSDDTRHSLRYHLGPLGKHTVYEAEAVGLLLAIQLLISARQIQKPCYIFVDNQAVVRSSVQPKSKSGHHLLVELRHSCRRLRRKHNLRKEDLIVAWLPGHQGVPGNEAVDQEAKSAASTPANSSDAKKLPKNLRTDPIPSSISALKAHYRNISKARWTAEWSKSSRHPLASRYGLSSPTNSYIKLCAKLTKAQTAMITALYTGHAPLNAYLHRIRKIDSPVCKNCDADKPETTGHFILRCPGYANERHTLRNKLRTRASDLVYLLTDPNGVSALLQYIAETSRFSNTKGQLTLPT